MRVFFRYFFFLLFIVAAVLLISPYFIGRSVDKHYPQMIQQFANSNQFDAKVVSMEKGWFSSNAKVEVTINGRTVVLDQTIHHGFIVPYADSQGEHSTFAYASVTYHSRGDKGSPMDISGVWNFGSMELYATARNYQIKHSGLAFKVKDLDGQLNFSEKQHVLTGTLALDSLEAMSVDGRQQHPTSLSLTNVTARLHLVEKNHLWFGQQHYDIGDMILQNDGKHISLNGLNIVAQSSPSHHKIHSHITVRFQSLSSSKFTLDDFAFSLSLKDIDIQAMSQLAKVAKVAKTQEQMMQLIPLVGEVASKGFNITLDKLFVKTNMGPISVTGQIEVPASAQAVDLPVLMASLKADIDVSAPRSIYAEVILEHFKKQQLHLQQQMQGNIVSAQQLTHQAIEQWIKNHMFIVSGDNLEMKAQFRGGKIMVNGFEANFALPSAPKPEQPPLPESHLHMTTPGD